MSMGIVTIRVVDTHIGTHPLRHKIGMDKIGQQSNPFISVQFNW